MKEIEPLTVEKFGSKEFAIYSEGLCLGSYFVGGGIVLLSSKGSAVEVEVIEALAAKMREIESHPEKFK